MIDCVCLVFKDFGSGLFGGDLLLSSRMPRILVPKVLDLLASLSYPFFGLPVLLLENDLREIFMLIVDPSALFFERYGEELLREYFDWKAKPRSSFEGSSRTIELYDFLPFLLRFLEPRDPRE